MLTYQFTFLLSKALQRPCLNTSARSLHTPLYLVIMVALWVQGVVPVVWQSPEHCAVVGLAHSALT